LSQEGFSRDRSITAIVQKNLNNGLKHAIPAHGKRFNFVDFTRAHPQLDPATKVRSHELTKGGSVSRT
jgi:hypothetical protein